MRTPDDTWILVHPFYPLLIKLFPPLQQDLNNIKGIRKKFGFLFTSDILQSLDNNSLKSSCENLETVLTRDGKSDIDAKELYVELQFL